MAARLTRARKRLAGESFVVPAGAELADRVRVVSGVAYLAFTAGYAPGSGPDVLRADVAAEAIRLVRVLRDLLPEPSSEVDALLALMLLQHSRRGARTDAGDALVLLEEQDRARWDHDMIDEGLGLLDDAIVLRRPGPYQVQAAIAALHARAPRPEDTDWPQIAALYGRLADRSPSPVIELNRAVAVAMADGPAAGLPLVEALAPQLDGYHLFHAARADLLRRLDRPDEAAASYRRALELVTNPTEVAYLERRLREVTGEPA
jgi:RNA polymerase sigma-70 factor (ECF subfamily)